MKTLGIAGLAALLLLAGAGVAGAQTDSVHRKGPDGLQGWTKLYPSENHADSHADASAEAPKELVITRNGAAIRTIKGDPYIWKWMFMENGTQVAFEAGQEHSGMACILADIETGAEVDSFDCYYGAPAEGAPDWVGALQATDKAATPE